MCKTRDETVAHIIRECSKLAQTDYKARHDRGASAVHWIIMKAHGLPHTKSWYEHRADKVVETKDVKVLWDFNIHVDKFIEARRPDIILVRKIEERMCRHKYCCGVSRMILEPRWKNISKLKSTRT